MNSAPPSTTTGSTTPMVAVLALAGTTAAMMQSIITPLLTELPSELGTTPGSFAWAVTITLLMAAVFTPIAGRLGDMFGKRRVLLACTVPLVVGSVLCAIATSLAPMIVGRGLQGLGLGMIPVSIALLRDVLPPQRLSTAVALLSASMGIGGGIAIPLAAVVAQYSSWRILFWGCAALSLLIAVLILTLVPEGHLTTTKERFDAGGAVGLGAGLVSLFLGITQGSHWGWGSAGTIGCFAGAVVLLVGWGWWELRTPHPLVDLRTAARREVLFTNIASVFAGMGMYVTLLATPQILMLPTSSEVGLGQTMVVAGLLLLPGGVIQMFLSPVSGRLIDSRGPRATLILGALVIAAGYGSMQGLLGSAVGLMIAHMIIKAGVGIAYGAMPALIMQSVPRSKTGSANSFNALMRSLGATTGAAVVGVVLAQMVSSGDSAPITSEAGFRVAYLVGLGVALAAAAFACVIPTRRRLSAQQAAAAELEAELVASGPA